MNQKVVYRIKIMNCIYKVMGNTFQRFRKAEPNVSKDVSGSIISFDMSGIEFVSTEGASIDVSGVQVTMEPIETPHTVVTVVPIMPMFELPAPPFEIRLVPECENIDTRRGAIFDALLAEIYGDALIDYESFPKDPEEVNICAHLCRRLLRFVNPNKITRKMEELDSEPSEKTIHHNTNRKINSVRRNILDATNQTGKCKTV